MESLQYLTNEKVFQVPGQRAALRPLRLTGSQESNDCWPLHDMIKTRPAFLPGFHDLAEYESPYVQYRFETVRRDQKGEFLGFVDTQGKNPQQLAGWIMFLSGLYQARAAAAVWDDDRLVANASPIEITIMKAPGVAHEVVVSALNQAGLMVLLHDVQNGLSYQDENSGAILSPRIIYGDIDNANTPARTLVAECGYAALPTDSPWSNLIPLRERPKRQIHVLDWAHLTPLLAVHQSPSYHQTQSQ